jgi:hypothetical protein
MPVSREVEGSDGTGISAEIALYLKNQKKECERLDWETENTRNNPVAAATYISVAQLVAFMMYSTVARFCPAHSWSGSLISGITACPSVPTRQ